MPQTPTGLSTEQLVVLFFHEVPNQGAAIAALVLYTAVSMAVFATTIKTRTWYMTTVTITGLLEVAGFATRLAMLHAPSLNVYIIHQALLIISPVLLAVVEYMTAAKLMLLGLQASASGGNNSSGSNSNSSRVSSPFQRFVRWFFLASEVFCLLLQSSGGALYGNPARAATARQLLLAGLGAQLGFFSAFIAIVVHVQLSRSYGFRGNAAFVPVFTCLYVTVGLLHVRNIFRVVEFAMGYNGVLATHELYFYVFDLVPVMGSMLCFACLHYGRWLGPHAPAAVAMRSAGGADARASVQQAKAGQAVDSSRELVTVVCA